MASFKQKEITSTTSIISQQKNKPIIYVEGESDKRIFENYWFVEFLGKVSFNITPDVQGCSAVVNTVASDRTKGIPAFGLVDRDKLMTDERWDLLRQVDDVLFEKNWPYPDIKITCRWELESYLIEPEALESYLAPAQGGRAPRALAEVENELLLHADALVPFSALNQAMHLHRIKAPKDGYTKLDSRSIIENRINDEKLKNFPHISDDYFSNIPLIDAFGGAETLTPRQRLYGLLRGVNGKAMLDRISQAAKLKDDITYQIAKEIRQLNRVPIELKLFVQSCCD
ncbi:hypothetical protein ACQ4WY_25230 [Janthinobacterium sp. LB2P49]|uniref:hypothetical protein n=1 Tax=Janthinobacterium sp. LB2P49 TaxID=3424198 RepID=UPI003F20FE1A